MNVLPAILLVFATTSHVRGEYDSLVHRATVVVPPRLKVLRDSLLSGLYEEAMFHLLSYYAPVESRSALCRNHSTLYQTAFLEDQLWAVKMLDASSKLPDGLFQGNVQSLGMYDECLEVEEPSHQFSGQMCLVQTRGIIPPVAPNTGTTEFSLIQPLPLDLTMAICVPSTCSAEDIQVHWQEVMGDLNVSVAVSTKDCSIKDGTQPDFYYWLTLGVLATLFAVVLASTCYDYSVKHQPTKERRILISFSAYANLRKLFSSERHADSLDVLDGVRFLAISWIVLGHRFEQSLQVPNITLTNLEKYTTAWFMSPILNMELAVELFFLLSGCLLAYHFLQSRVRRQPFSLSHFYYKRYIRLTPALAVVMLLEGCLMLHVSDGPLWKRLVGHRVDSCVNYWWSSLLYVSNYVNPYNTCVLQSWYLSTDTQLYVLSPLLLLPLARSGKGLLLLATCYLATTVAAFCNAFYLQLPSGGHVTLDKKAERNYGYEYVKTHVRAASWLTGIALGYTLQHLRHRQHAFKLSKVLAAFAWTVSVCLCLGAIYSLAPFQSLEYQYSPIVDSLHIALFRNAFSLGAAGMVLLCICGRGGFVKDLLAWGGFRPLATLSYGVYLCHMGMQMVSLARIRQPYSFDMFSLSTGFLSDLLLANLMAIILYITVEAPFWEVGRWLYSQDNKPKAAVERSPRNNIPLEDEKSAL